MLLVFTLAPATTQHAPEIAEVYVRTRRLAYAPFFPVEVLDAMSVALETTRWQARIGQQHSRTVAAFDAVGAIAGFTHLSWHDADNPTTGEIEYMYVATERQGNRLGALLMAEAEAGLTEAGMHDAVLWVYEGNTPARGFYERCGWAWDGGTKPSDSAPGLRLLRYRKQLGASSG